MNIVNAILAQATPTRYGNTLHPGDWPADAKYAVSYRVRDRQFPSVRHEDTVVYFATMNEFMVWRAKQHEWMRSTDYDFSMTFSFYTWDWGPVFRFCR